MLLSGKNNPLFQFLMGQKMIFKEKIKFSHGISFSQFFLCMQSNSKNISDFLNGLFVNFHK